MKTLRPPIKSLIFFGIEIFGAIIFVLCSALVLSAFSFKALILAECAHVVYRSVCWFYFFNNSIKVENVKRFIHDVFPGVVAILIIWALNRFVKSEQIISVVDFVTKLITAIMIIKLMTSKAIDGELSTVIYCRKLTPKITRLCKISKLYRFFIALGLALTIIVKPYVKFYFEVFTIIGCVLLICRSALAIYCWCACELLSASETNQDLEEYSQDTLDEILYDSDSNGNKGERTLNEHDVYLKVKKIADRWSHKEDTFFSVSSGHIQYDVSVEIMGF
ncbi:MAG: hypothetical protein K2N32_00190, partial [Clostridia bacterium]|nr:hypothetical protein [Clostridia bacterium]